MRILYINMQWYPCLLSFHCHILTSLLQCMNIYRPNCLTDENLSCNQTAVSHTYQSQLQLLQFLLPTTIMHPTCIQQCQQSHNQHLRWSWLFMLSLFRPFTSFFLPLRVVPGSLNTGGIERFSAQEIFGKILKVSHFYLGFSPDQKNNWIKHSQRVSLEFSESLFKTFDKTLEEPKNSDRMVWECSISSWFSFSENPK